MLNEPAFEINQWRSMQPLVLDGISINSGIGKGVAHFHNSISKLNYPIRSAFRTAFSHFSSTENSEKELSEDDRLKLALTRLREEIELLISAADSSIDGPVSIVEGARGVLDSVRLLAHDRGWESRLVQCVEDG